MNKGKDIHHFVEQAIETGFSHLDTAQCELAATTAITLTHCALDYANESSVGTAIRESGLSRSELYITSKYGYGDVEVAFNASLKSVSVVSTKTRYILTQSH